MVTAVMGALFRRRRLPADRRPPLVPEERVVAWAFAGGPDVVVATNLGLWLPGRASRLGWHEIHKVTWSGPQLTVVPAVTVSDGPDHSVVADGPDYSVVADAPAVSFPLLDPGRVPEQVRTRVNRSIAYTAHHPLPAGGGVRVVARRVPGVDGLRWTVRYDAGVDPAAPGVAETTAELVASGRRSVP